MVHDLIFYRYAILSSYPFMIWFDHYIYTCISRYLHRLSNLFQSRSIKVWQDHHSRCIIRSSQRRLCRLLVLLHPSYWIISVPFPSYPRDRFWNGPHPLHASDALPVDRDRLAGLMDRIALWDCIVQAIHLLMLSDFSIVLGGGGCIAQLAR